jgi:hypothetical protein
MAWVALSMVIEVSLSQVIIIQIQILAGTVFRRRQACMIDVSLSGHLCRWEGSSMTILQPETAQ